MYFILGTQERELNEERVLTTFLILTWVNKWDRDLSFEGILSAHENDSWKDETLIISMYSNGVVHVIQTE